MASSLVSFVHEILTVAFSELVDGFLSLLDECLQDLDGFGFVERVNFLGFFVLDGGLDAAQDAEPEFVLCTHGVDQVFLNFFGDTHKVQYSRRKERKKIYAEVTEAQRSQRRGTRI